MRILVKGAGITGLTTALALTRYGHRVTIAEKAASAGLGASHYAGGMLAPWCEGESADRQIVDAGIASIAWWEEALPNLVHRRGTLVVAKPRDHQELERFASRTSQFEWVDELQIGELEPALAGRFKAGLYFPREAHLDPRAALSALQEKLISAGAAFRFLSSNESGYGFDQVVDCTGPAWIHRKPSLRGVRGEMLYLKTGEIVLSRPVRLLHPRIPLYISPQSENRFMVGATMIESDQEGPITARSAMELLNAAYSLHPAFGEAELIETGSGIRPAYDDNIPRISEADGVLSLNGMYRHGFLMAPYLAEALAARLETQSVKTEAVA